MGKRLERKGKKREVGKKQTSPHVDQATEKNFEHHISFIPIY